MKSSTLGGTEKIWKYSMEANDVDQRNKFSIDGCMPYYNGEIKDNKFVFVCKKPEVWRQYIGTEEIYEV